MLLTESGILSSLTDTTHSSIHELLLKAQTSLGTESELLASDTVCYKSLIFCNPYFIVPKKKKTNCNQKNEL